MKITKSQLRKIIKEARMAQYGNQDAAAGRPPSKVGRKDTEYMAAYEDEKENQISSRKKKFGAEDPRAPSPKSHEYPDAGSNFRRAVMNMVLQQVDLSVPPGKREQLINDIQLAFENAGIGGPISRVE